MGLDQYAFTTSQDILDVDFDSPEDSAELFYWRKHPNLQGWMEKLYREKGGEDTEFNCSVVQLTEEDLDELAIAVASCELPETEGFFFGKSYPEDKERDTEFLDKAYAALKRGKKVYYSSWW